MAYQRISEEERTCIYRWKQAGKGVREIGRLLGRDAGSISREIGRNSGRKGYRPKQAHEMAVERARRSGYRRLTQEVRDDIESKVRQGWTPDMIAGRAWKEGRPHVCKETGYRYIYADAKAGGTLWTYLPRAGRKRMRRCPRADGRGRIPNRRSIDTRPAEVEDRRQVGHWEGDLVNGSAGSGNLVTLVERSTRYALVGRVGTKEADEVYSEICRLLGGVPEKARSTLTLDNGKEFARHEAVASELSIGVFFAHPYHSWERGSNENRNGMVRRIHPKKSSFADVGKAELLRLDDFLNDRPMKCLGWATPREKMSEYLSASRRK